MHVPFMQVSRDINRPEYANLSRLLNTVAAFLSFLLPGIDIGKGIKQKTICATGLSLGYQR
jgi:hypothetical protein